MSSSFKKRATECIYKHLTDVQIDDGATVAALLQIDSAQTLENFLHYHTIDIDNPRYVTVKFYYQWLTEAEAAEANDTTIPIQSPLLARTLNLTSPSEEIDSTTTESSTIEFIILDSWLTPIGQLLRRGVLPDSDEGKAYIAARTTAAQLAATTLVEKNRPKLSTSLPKNVIIFREHYGKYIIAHGLYAFLDCIDSTGRDSISVDLLPDGIIIDWDNDDEEYIIGRILHKYCSESSAKRITMSMICDGIAMKKSVTFDLGLMKEYTGRFFARQKMYPSVLSTIGIKDKIHHLMEGMYPKHYYVKLLKEQVLHLAQWKDVWNRVSALNVVFDNNATVETALKDDVPKEPYRGKAAQLQEGQVYTKKHFARMVNAGIQSGLKDAAKKLKPEAKKPTKGAGDCPNCPKNKNHDGIHSCRYACVHPKCRSKDLHLASKDMPRVEVCGSCNS